MAAQKRPTIVLVASTVGWLLGVILLLTGVALLIPAVTMHSLRWGIVPPLAVGVAYCVSGYLLRRGVPSGALLGVVASGLFLVLVLVGGGLRPSAGMLVHALFFAVALGAWSKLRGGAGAVEAEGAPEEAEPEKSGVTSD